jgi:hypothetical protein
MMWAVMLLLAARVPFLTISSPTDDDS